MAKRRTRKEKQAAKHVYTPVYTLEGGAAAKGTGLAPANGQAVGVGLSQVYDLHTDTPLIKKDLAKSVMISGLILLIEFVIFWYWYK